MWRAVSLWVVLCSLAGGEDRSSGCSSGVPFGRCVRTWTAAGAVPAARVSRFAGLGDGRAAFGGFLVVLGELPGGRPSIFGESLEAPGGLFYVGEQTVRFLLLWCPRVGSGRGAVQAEHVTASSVFEYAWQLAMPPLSVLLQG